jgi:putative zinc finger/helix-turn-helix YgiT family protein
MNCIFCGGEMETSREDYPYSECGLEGAVLVDVETSRCPECGEEETAIPAIEGLHGAIAARLIAKVERLTAGEVRFLRKHIGLSGVELARRLGVDPATVSRWETGNKPIGVTADRLLRVMVACVEPCASPNFERLTNMAVAPAKPVTMRLVLSGRASWVEEGSVQPLAWGELVAIPSMAASAPQGDAAPASFEPGPTEPFETGATANANLSAAA